MDSILHILPIPGQILGEEVVKVSAHRGNKAVPITRRNRRKSNKALNRRAKGVAGGTSRHRSKSDPKPTRHKRKRK